MEAKGSRLFRCVLQTENRNKPTVFDDIYIRAIYLNFAHTKTKALLTVDWFVKGLTASLTTELIIVKYFI